MTQHSDSAIHRNLQNHQTLPSKTRPETQIAKSQRSDKTENKTTIQTQKFRDFKTAAKLELTIPLGCNSAKIKHYSKACKPTPFSESKERHHAPSNSENAAQIFAIKTRWRLRMATQYTRHYQKRINPKEIQNSQDSNS